MSELELKFHLPAAAVRSLRRELVSRGAQAVKLSAAYYDTADGALARRRMSLRLRREGDRHVQTFKAGGDSPIHRLEHEVPVMRPGRTPALDLSRHAGHAAELLLRDVLGDPPPPLIPRQASSIERLLHTVRDAQGSVIEIALDLGRVTAGRRSAAIEELELEHRGGPVSGLFALASAWVAHGGLWLSTVSKAERGDRLRSGTPPSPIRAAPVSVRHDADGLTLIKAVLRSALTQVLANASEVAEGSDDADVVHQLRVGLRRLRTALRELAPLCSAIDPAWEEPLAVAFGKLGECRDRQVVIEAVQPLLAAAGLPAPRARPLPPVDLAAAVRAPDFQLALLGALAIVHQEPAERDGSEPADRLDEPSTRAFLTKRLNRLHRQVRRDGRRFDALAPDAQHRVRKRLKRLRYLAEFVQALWPDEASTTRYLDRLKPMQDTLGKHNDVVVAAGLYEEADDVASVAAARYLHSHLKITGKKARRALRKLRNRDRFWSASKH